MRIASIIIFILVAAHLQACTPLRDPFNTIADLKENQPDLKAAGLPDLRQGDFFTYSDNITHVVSKTTKDRIIWRIGTTFSYQTSRNFVLPWLSMKTDKISLEANIEDDIGGLWPLAPGKAQRYRLETKIVKAKQKNFPVEYREDQDCWVAGTETVQVPAGTFDTFVVVCHQSILGFHIKNNVWYYAPEVGNAVKKSEGRKEIELLGYGISLESLPENLRIEIDGIFQQALQTKASGQSLIWRSRNTRDSIETKPTGTYRLEDGRYCRDYTQNIILDGRTRSLTGRACRGPSGRWE